MTDQELFDTVAVHLLEQGQPSYHEDGRRCAYRGEHGFKCAIGVLIPDSKYNPDIELIGTLRTHMREGEKSIRPRGKTAFVRQFLDMIGLAPSQHYLASALQDTHDESPAECWAEELCDIATNAKLSDAVVRPYLEKARGQEDARN